MKIPFVLGLIPTAILALPALGDNHGNDAAIERAMSAAPPAISVAATIMRVDGTVLRELTKDWSCFPGSADTDTDPSSNDAAWTHYTLTDKDQDGSSAEIKSTGVSYMLASDPPHLMIIVPEAGGLDGLNTATLIYGNVNNYAAGLH